MEKSIKEQVAELYKRGYTSGHHAWARGYISRKSDGYLEEYSGRYGEGYILHEPSWGSTIYHEITYFIKGE